MGAGVTVGLGDDGGGLVVLTVVVVVVIGPSAQAQTKLPNITLFRDRQTRYKQTCTFVHDRLNVENAIVAIIHKHNHVVGFEKKTAYYTKGE